MMSRTLRLALLALACAVDLSWASGFTDNGLSLLSYQLCSYPVTRNVQRLQEVQASHTAYVHCGAWIPWKKCPKTVYRTQYLPVEVPESRNVTDCCKGFEQLGFYCVLPLNRSREFASRPGVCPTAEPESSSPPCSLDIDCSGLQKCCSWSGAHRCVAPAPTGAERIPVSWYNVTVLVKMGFEDLQREDPGFRNHTRLLYSLVTSALQPLNSSVHYLNSAGGTDIFTTVSWLLLGLPRRLTVDNVSATLDDVVNRVYEVVSIQVQDVNECLHRELHACSGGEQCLNIEGSYQCVPTQPPNRTDEGDTVTPTGGGQSVTTKVSAPGVTVEITSLGPDTLTFSPSPRHPRSTPTRSQAWTPGPPSKRGSSSTARTPEPTHGSPPKTTVVPLHATGGPQANLTVDPPLVTASPTGYVAWHPSPTWEAPPPNSTRLQNEDPRPSLFPGLPSASTPVASESPACVPGPIGKVTVSNMTSTGFSLEWSADISFSPTFYLTLVSPRGPAVTMETRDNNVILSGLEPGALHLVEIVAKVCGKEGARKQLRVRTVARKLAGEVRIANIQYSESFRNASSREHRDLVQLFFRMVRESLPAPLCQHMDAGRIRVDIIDITNGSVVVEFNLLIMADLDVREVSATFLTALQNTSVLEVDKGRTFIQDYNECEMREDDCEPGMCRNTFGSFTCSCDGGDSHVEYSGRSCDGGSSSNTIQTPGPEWPPTPAGTRVDPVPDASSVPQDPPPRLNLTDAVGVSCEIEMVVITIQKRFLQQEAIPEASLYLGEPSCNVSNSNSTHVFLVAGWGQCGTLVQSNMTSTVVTTTLKNDLSPEGVIHHLQILSPIHCAFRNDLLTSSGYTPQWGVYTIIEDLHGTGNFVTEMQLFIGDSPIPQNYSVSASDEIKIEVGLHRQKSSLKVVLTECWATPSSNARDPVTFGFINNSCPVPNTYTSVIQNGNSSKAQFKLRIFSFVNNSIVYLHCKLRVCMENPRNSCRISCNDFRLLRSSEAEHQMSWGPLHLSEGEPARTNPGLGTRYIIIIAVAAFTVVAGATTLLILRYQRMRGKYSLRIQTDDFSYQVFAQ
ncbi:uromodulin-like 1 [Microtus ochrogaster]|uniref:Uromodulin-like 1 n=1 Tax=Microtus ochrogaster TaxID=79684 RepID=A0ABM1AQS7_MICOH|nr:uromodulin-like 1 [Microtus ochrogaster]